MFLHVIARLVEVAPTLNINLHARLPLSLSVKTRFWQVLYTAQIKAFSK